MRQSCCAETAVFLKCDKIETLDESTGKILSLADNTYQSVGMFQWNPGSETSIEYRIVQQRRYTNSIRLCI